MYRNIKIFLAFILLTQIANSQVELNYLERRLLAVSDTISFSSSVSDFPQAIDEENYFVGAGDLFLVSIKGIENQQYNVAVTPEGYLYIPTLGAVKISGMKLSEAKSEVLSFLNKKLKNVEAFISLSKVRKIRINIIGEVKKPASLIVPANIDLHYLISQGAFLTNEADWRNIEVKRNSQSFYYDYLSYLRTGNRDNNPPILDNDIISIHKIDKKISVSGAVPNPAIYEYRKDESLFHLLMLAGGFTERAKKDTVEIIRFKKDNFTQYSIYFPYDEKNAKSFLLNSGDHVVVREIPDYLRDNTVTILGLVAYPGVYQIIDEKTKLSEIVRQSGGFLPNASLIDASLYRKSRTIEFDPEWERLKLMQTKDMNEDEYDYFKSKSRERSGKVVVDFISIFQNQNRDDDVVLRRGDFISIPEKKNYVTLIGQVVNPGKVTYNPHYSIQDYINSSGGFAWRALDSDVRLVRSNTGEWIDEDDVTEILPGDIIWVPEDPPPPKFWDVFTTSLTVLGQVATVVAATVAVIVAVK